MDISAAIEQVKKLYHVAETANNLEAGERSVERWVGTSMKDFISSMDFNQYVALLGLYGDSDEHDEWIERAQQFVSSLSDEQIDLFSRIWHQA
ncbi:hypothetical protein [Collinsella tanakaei]|uniref:hypothetical protein n=1 Tax=Collinsella tanakaei TaxID=626935 RepID=UPI0025A404FB|nr:hypothetical protein [Collinsella tanakaei]MDM8300906.1 hypothetical protein [Collinsella tanakaei]